jgi:CspA family cold shock protein
MRTLRENQRVSYDLQQDNRGKMSAVNLQAAEDSTQAQPSGEQPANDQEEQAANDQQAE